MKSCNIPDESQAADDQIPFRSIIHGFIFYKTLVKKFLFYKAWAQVLIRYVLLLI